MARKLHVKVWTQLIKSQHPIWKYLSDSVWRITLTASITLKINLALSINDHMWQRREMVGQQIWVMFILNNILILHFLQRRAGGINFYAVQLIVAMGRLYWCWQKEGKQYRQTSFLHSSIKHTYSHVRMVQVMIQLITDMQVDIWVFCITGTLTSPSLWFNDEYTFSPKNVKVSNLDNSKEVFSNESDL